MIEAPTVRTVDMLFVRSKFFLRRATLKKNLQVLHRRNDLLHYLSERAIFEKCSDSQESKPGVLRSKTAIAYVEKM